MYGRNQGNFNQGSMNQYNGANRAQQEQTERYIIIYSTCLYTCLSTFTFVHFFKTEL